MFIGISLSLTGGGIHLDPLAPAAPVSIDLKSTSDTGASSSDDLTNDTTPTFVVTLTDPAAEDDIVHVYETGTSIGSHTVTAGEVGETEFEVTVSALADGSHSVRARHEFPGHLSPVSPALVVTIDTTAPILSSPDISDITETTATARVTTNEGSGTLYMVITDSTTVPSAAQIRAGQDHAGAAADFADDVAVASAGVKSFNVTGLTGGTEYWFYATQRDAAGNDSNVTDFGPFETSAADAPGAGVLARDSNGGGRTPVFTVSGLAAAGAVEGDTVRIYTIVEPDGVSFTEYVNDTISAGEIVADEITLTGVTLLDDALYQAHARIENGNGLGDLSNEVEFAINTALTLTALFGPEVDYSTGFNFLIEGDLEDDDRIVIEADQDSAFGSVDDTGSLVYDNGNFVDDDPVNALGPLANGLTYFRCYRERAGADDSDYSNTQSTTIALTLTAAERMSAPHVQIPWRGLYPIPDSTIAAADRKAAANLYSGV